MTVSVSGESNGRVVTQSLQLDVRVDESYFGNLSSDLGSTQDFIGIEVGNSKSQIITFRNDGNTVLDGDVSAIVLDSDDIAASGWDVEVSTSKISGLAPGETIELKVGVEPNDKSKKGSYQVVINVTSN